MNDTSRYKYYCITCITSETFTFRLYLSCVRKCARVLLKTVQTRKILSELSGRRGQWLLEKTILSAQTTFLRSKSVGFTTTLGTLSICYLFDIFSGIPNSRMRSFGTYLYTRTHSLLQREKYFSIFSAVFE